MSKTDPQGAVGEGCYVTVGRFAYGSLYILPECLVATGAVEHVILPLPATLTAPFEFTVDPRSEPGDLIPALAALLIDIETQHGAREGDASMTKRTVRPKAKPMTKRTLTNLAQRIRKSHELATTGLLAALAHARDAGTLLREAKQHFEHGEWLPWLKSQVGLSARTAQTYMRISLRWRELEAKTQRVADLPLREATKLLAAPSRASGPEYENETDPKARWMKFDQWADAMTVGWESDLAVVNQIVDSPTSTVRQLVFAHDIAHQMSNATHEIELRCMREMGLILNDWESMGLDIHWIVNHLTEFRAGLKQAAEAKFGKGCFDDETIEHVEQGEGESTPSNISKATMHDRQLIASVTDSEFQAYVDGCNSGQQPTPLRRKGKVK